jgi:hypothetical protein
MFPQISFRILQVFSIAIIVALLIVMTDNVYLDQTKFIPTYEVNRVQKGDTYRQFSMDISASPKECMKKCLAEDECMAWNYIIPDINGANGLCQLKHESTIPLIDLKAISGIARK